MLIDNPIEKVREEDYAKLKMFFVELPEKKLFLLDSSIRSLSFFRIELAILERTILKEGVSQAYTNGKNQGGVKKSVNVQTYIELQKAQMKTAQMLIDYLPYEKQRGFMGIASRPLNNEQSKMIKSYYDYLCDEEKEEGISFEKWKAKYDKWYKEQYDLSIKSIRDENKIVGSSGDPENVDSDDDTE